MKLWIKRRGFSRSGAHAGYRREMVAKKRKSGF
jgi:hypothetical protein